jgi:hypothetical protein
MGFYEGRVLVVELGSMATFGNVGEEILAS